MVDSIFEELEELIPDEGRRIEWMIEAGIRVSAEAVRLSGHCNCMRCGKRIEGEVLCCDDCMDCQQCYHPKSACLCNNENFIRHLRNILKEHNADNAERIKNNGWKTR